MGAGAFIMVQFTSIDYGTIARSAVIPALLYFLGCAFAVIFRAEVEKNTDYIGLAVVAVFFVLKKLVKKNQASKA